MAEDDQEKTEEPTQKKLEEASKQGQVIQSRELNNFFIFLIILLIINFQFIDLMRESKFFLSNIIDNVATIRIDDKFIDFLIRVLKKSAYVIITPFMFLWLFALVSTSLQNGRIVFNPAGLKFDFNKISITKGLGRLFSTRSVLELVKGIIKICAAAIIVYFAVSPLFPQIMQVYRYHTKNTSELLIHAMISIFNAICIFLAFIAALDYFFQRKSFFQGLKMSKHEIKEEMKQAEGSPEIKRRIRSIRMARFRKSMMNVVPQADVIIANPTHYAIALEYKQKKMSAPICVAKGIDDIALGIRKIAEKNNIPVIVDRPLARILYNDLVVGEEIPLKHYQTVAEVIKYIYSLDKKT